MSKPKPQADSFWVSYSDLSTGLMIVFMLVMLIMVILQKQTGEIQTNRVKEVVRKIEIILGQKAKLSESINHGFSDDQSITADPVTAQLSIDETQLQFSENRARLKPEGKTFLESFGPKYICTLFAYERQYCAENENDCRRIDPENPGSVRRIFVQGHADMKGKFVDNHKLSTERAEAVVQKILKDLRCISDGKCDDIFSELHPLCQKHTSSMLGYAEERLWAVGAGETLHCTTSLNGLDGPRAIERCDAIIREEPSFRKVNFALELTGDDMTGLLADVVSLRNTVGGLSGSEAPIDELSDIVAESCWLDPSKYHGCQDFGIECLSTVNPEGYCASFFNLINEDPLKTWAKGLCDKEMLQNCSEIL